MKFILVRCFLATKYVGLSKVYRKWILFWWTNMRGSQSVVVKVLDFDFLISEFELQLRYYTHFWTNTRVRVIKHLTPSAIGKIVPLLSFCHILICRCMQKHNGDTIKTSGHSSLEKYTSHFIRKGCVWEVSWRLNRTATYWPSLFWP